MTAKKSFRYSTLLMPVLGLGIFAIAIGILAREIRNVSIAEISAQFSAIPTTEFILAAILTALSYFLLTYYDFLGFKYLKQNTTLRKVALISFSAFAVGHNVGVASLSGGAVRYRAYSLAGLTTTQIAILIAFIPLTFSLGVALLIGLIFVFDPATALSSIPVKDSTLRIFGFLLIALVALYLLTLTLRKNTLQIGQWTVQLPTIKIGVYQLLLSTVDLLLTCLVLYAFLRSSSDISFLVLLGAFILSIVVGIISSVPGAIGVFESSMVLLLPEVPAPTLLGAILAYRLIYYLIPFLLAIALIALREAVEHRNRLKQITDFSKEWATSIVPQALGAAIFLAGAYLLVSGSIPMGAGNARIIETLVPLQLLEMSHLASSAIGLSLLLVARGLYRRLHRAWIMTIMLLLLGIFAAFIQFNSWLHPALLISILTISWVARAEFYRGKSLLEQRFDSGWIFSISLVLIAMLGIGLFANRNIEYSNDLWWQFTFGGDASRMLRASLLAMVMLSIFGLMKFLRGSSETRIKPSIDELNTIKSILANEPSSYANIALLADKQFLFHPSREAFLMYQVSGGSWIALSDPIGNSDKFEELIWQFRESCDNNNVRCVFYQISNDYLPFYIDLGLSFLKLGEEAVVKLNNFTLEGSHRADLRQALNKGKRNGTEFSIIPASDIHTVMDELELVSKSWMKGKSSEEKGFSLGYFDRTYLGNFDCAIVKVNSEIVAFSNLWKGGTGKQLSVDLMRYSDKAHNGIMDYLFVEIMLWGQANGFQEFYLGMAPLSGLEVHTLASSWHKIGNLIYRFGENFYNFEGLRHYKEKFEPEWEPRFLACKGGVHVPAVLLDTTVLISGGLKGIFSK